MLSISEPLKGAGRANYYLAHGREGYYLDGGEPLGQWHGKGASALGLEGIIGGADFRNVLNGFSPDGKQSLTQNAGSKDRRSGWDLTFNAPKSVSALWSQASPEVRRRIQEAHEAAVREALDYLEDTAGVTRRGKGGKFREPSPFIVGMFEHGTSRVLEPHLHTHAVLANIALRSDGTTGALESKPIFEAKMAGGLAYRTKFAHRLEHDLGLAIKWDDGMFELRDVPKDICERFSTRRHEIKAALAERGLSSQKAARIAALDTRGKKKLVPREVLFETWQRIGQAMGFGPERAAALTVAHKHQQSQDKENATQGRKGARRESGGQGGTQADAKPDKGKSSKPRPFPPEPQWRKRKGRMYGKIHLVRESIFAEVRIQDKSLFPNAPGWSPAAGLKAPAIVIKGKAWGPQLVRLLAEKVSRRHARRADELGGNPGFASKSNSDRDREQSHGKSQTH